MRFVRHKTLTAWGLGIVTGEDQTKIFVLFDGVGPKKVAKSVHLLVEVPDAEVPSDHPLREPDSTKAELNVKRAGAMRDLPQRFDAFIKEFLDRFPGGLRSEECDDIERTYKVQAGEYAHKELSPETLDALLAGGDYKEIVSRARRCLSKVNLVYPNELMKFGDIPESAHQVVAERLVRLVEAGENTPAALEDLAAVLMPHGAAKWTIVSLLPFLLNPARWPFVKPTFIERTTKATGVEVDYESQPNAHTYNLIRELYEKVFRTLSERGPMFAPRDFIDVQTFLWVASGMKRGVGEERARKAGKTE